MKVITGLVSVCVFLLSALISHIADAAISTGTNGADEEQMPIRRLKDDEALFRAIKHGEDTPWRSMLVNAEKMVKTCGKDIPPFTDYTTNLKQEIMNQFGKNVYDQIMKVVDMNLTFFVLAYKYYHDEFDASKEVLGLNGHGHLDKAIKESHRRLDGFYGSTDLLSCHGYDLSDVHILRKAMIWTGLAETFDDARTLSVSVQNIIVNTIGYNHPILTLNAYSVGTDFVAIGDGIFDFFHSHYAEKGLRRYHPLNAEKTAADASMSTLTENALLHAHAHEFGHIRQMQLELRDPEKDPTPDETRYFELFSDAISAFYQASPSGRKLSTTAIYDVFASSFGLGDCLFDDDTHHGTPAQRECAAFWGASLAWKRNDIVTDSVGSHFEIVFAERFEEVYRRLLALDKTLCPRPPLLDIPAKIKTNKWGKKSEPAPIRAQTKSHVRRRKKKKHRRNNN